MLTISVPGARIAVRERGSGIPVVLVHGGTGTGEHDWGEIAERLSRRHRTVVVDLRGHGKSSDPHEQLGVVRIGLDLEHVLRALGMPRAVLIGFSVGGNSVLKLLAREPRLALAAVTIGSSARGDASRVEAIMTGPWPSYLTELEHEVGDGPEYWKRLRGILARDWAHNLAIGDEELRRISCPVLVCHGDRDRIQEIEYAHHLAETLPRAELLIVPGAGHAIQRDEPEVFLAAVEEFLGRVLARST